MRGIPHNALKTRADFEMLHQAALNDDLRPHEVSELRRHWQALLDGRFVYEFDRVLTDGEDPDGAEPDYRVMEDEDEETGEVTRTQHKLTESLCSRLCRLGFEASEVEAALAELEGK